MDYGDYYWGLYRDYYGDPFPQTLVAVIVVVVAAVLFMVVAYK